MRALIISACLALAMWATAPAQAEAPNAGNQLVGLWDVVATPFPGQAAPPIIMTQTVFGRDGTMASVGPSGPSVGAWQRERGGRYIITFVSYGSAGGDSLLLFTIESTVEIGADQQTVSGLFRTTAKTLVDPDGSLPPVFSFEGTIEGVRVPVRGF